MVKNIEQYKDTIPAVKDAAGLKETFWLNPKRCPPKKNGIFMLCRQKIL